MDKATIEALKELGRVLLFAGISWGIGYLTALPETQTTLVGLFILRTVDKYVHESTSIKASGITGF